jgi:hypothetical protein
MKQKICLSWSAHLASAHKSPPGYLEDLKGRAFDWDGDQFCLTEEDFRSLRKKYLVMPPNMVEANTQDAINQGGQPMTSRGLGDTIEKMTEFVGLRPCGGCKKRKKKLNDLVPYGHRTAK